MSQDQVNLDESKQDSIQPESPSEPDDTTQNNSSTKIKISAKLDAPLVKISQSSEDRKALRAKRFGAVDKLSERAQRFGLTKDGGIGKNNKPSAEVLKKRAERFGLSEKDVKIESNVKNVSSEVLKKRAERFGVISESVKELTTQEALAKRQKRFASEKV